MERIQKSPPKKFKFQPLLTKKQGKKERKSERARSNLFPDGEWMENPLSDLT